MRLNCGDWTIDDERRLVVRAGKHLRIEPKAFELLRVLISERPKALSKSELLQRIWHDAFVTDASLTRLVRHLRAALGDDANAPRYIRTIPRFGYAFCGEASEPGDRAVAPCRLVGHEGQVQLRQAHNVIGRRTHNVPSLDDPSVSRRHASIVIDGCDVSIEDLGSKNGTFIGADRLDGRRQLRDGDKVRFGLVAFVFRLSPPTSATRTVLKRPAIHVQRSSVDGRS
jgi:DNA-binding winged helix-turn-helix (wHTH) protein